MAAVTMWTIEPVYWPFLYCLGGVAGMGLLCALDWRLHQDGEGGLFDEDDRDPALYYAMAFLFWWFLTLLILWVHLRNDEDDS